MRVYLGHQISGLSGEEIEKYYNETTAYLTEKSNGKIAPMSPMDGDSYSCNHHIHSRDCWMIRQADVVYLNFLGMGDTTSIGMCMEAQCAWDNGIYCVSAIEPEGNIHQHAFILEASSLVLPTHEEVLEYLIVLSKCLKESTYSPPQITPKGELFK